MKLIGITLLLLIIPTSWDYSSSDESEEVAVYRAYLNAVFSKKRFSDIRFADKPFNLIVISNKTVGFSRPFPYLGRMGQLKPKPDEGTIQSFMTRNDANGRKSLSVKVDRNIVGLRFLDSRLKFDLPHILISEKEFEKTLAAGGWDEFYRRFPGSRGMIWLSRVGFNNAKSQALFYFGNQYTDYAGEGYLILMAKADEAWKEVAHITVWIS